MKKIKAFCSWDGCEETFQKILRDDNWLLRLDHPMSRERFMRLSRTRIFIFFIVIFFMSVISASADNSNMMKNQPETPKRIVSLSPAITEALYVLGLEDSIVGVTIYCQKPPRAQTKEKIGTLMEPDMERIVSLKPDLVLAMSLTSPKEIQKLKNLGLKVVTFQIPQDFNLLCDFFLQLGKVVGKEKDSATAC